jgi:predicted metal-binding protein
MQPLYQHGPTPTPSLGAEPCGHPLGAPPHAAGDVRERRRRDQRHTPSLGAERREDVASWRGPRELAKGRQPYALRGLITCGGCGRRLYHTTIKNIRYATCRLQTAEYASNELLAATHPKTSYLREDQVLPAVNGWRAGVFDPERIDRTAKALAAAAADESGQA